MKGSQTQYLSLFRLLAVLVVISPIVIDMFWFDQVIVSLVYVPLLCLTLALILRAMDVQFARMLIQEQGRQLRFKLFSFPAIKRKRRIEQAKKRRAA